MTVTPERIPLRQVSQQKKVCRGRDDLDVRNRQVRRNRRQHASRPRWSVHFAAHSQRAAETRPRVFSPALNGATRRWVRYALADSRRASLEGGQDAGMQRECRAVCAVSTDRQARRHARRLQMPLHNGRSARIRARTNASRYSTREHSHGLALNRRLIQLIDAPVARARKAYAPCVLSQRFSSYRRDLPRLRRQAERAWRGSLRDAFRTVLIF